MINYKCGFPGCDYRTNYRSYICKHHIKPKCDGGIDDEYNRIWLCPNHHVRIYIPGCTNGIHKICTSESIILEKWVMSSDGKLLSFRNAYKEEINYNK